MRYREGWLEVFVYRTPTRWAVRQNYCWNNGRNQYASLQRRRYVKSQEKAEQVAAKWRAA